MFKRWKLVLKLIHSGKGSNDLVESHLNIKKANFAQLLTVPKTKKNNSDDEETVRDMVKKAEV